MCSRSTRTLPLRLRLALPLVLLLAGCDGAATGGPVPTLPDATPAPPPALTEIPESPTPSAPPPVTTTPTAAPDPGPADEPASTSAPAGSASPAPSDPAALGRSLGVAGMVDLLAEDPELAGDRGRDLLQELRRIDEGRGRVDRRIRDLQERIPDWVDDGELVPAIGTAALAALEVAGPQPQPDGDDDGDDDNDDDD